MAEDALTSLSESVQAVHLNHTEPNCSLRTEDNDRFDFLYFDEQNRVKFRQYRDESDLTTLIPLISKDLSEPYSIYTFRYFIYNWPDLCLLAFCDDECVGTIVCKLEPHQVVSHRGYIAMLAVKEGFRRKGIGSRLVRLVIELMIKQDCDEVTLETEITNKSALALYERLGFCRDKRLFRYYLNGVDAFRLKLWLKPRFALDDRVA